MNNIRSLRCN